MTKLFPISIVTLILFASSCELSKQSQDKTAKSRTKAEQTQETNETTKPKTKTEQTRQAEDAKLSDICKNIESIKNPEPLKSIDELPKRFLNSHNDIRRRYNLPELVWDDELAQYAKRWANYSRDHYECKMVHRNDVGMKEGKKYGENLALSWTGQTIPQGQYIYSPEKSVLGWSKECKDYDYDTNKCASVDPGCGHFTQVVWKTTKKVGCGMVTCDGLENSKKEGHAELWVCNYDPPGNMTVNNVKQRPF